MNWIDWFVGFCFIVSGSLIAFRLHTYSDKRKAALIATALVCVGTGISIGQWIIIQILGK